MPRLALFGNIAASFNEAEAGNIKDTHGESIKQAEDARGCGESRAGGTKAAGLEPVLLEAIVAQY